MPSDEDLLREIQEQEEHDDAAYDQTLARRFTAKVDRKPIDVEAALTRHAKKWKPIIERRRRAEAGLPITKNPLFNLYLRLTGQDKIPVVESVEPTKGVVPVGKTVEEIRREIIEKHKP
jgi:hypothetical protein